MTQNISEPFKLNVESSIQCMCYHNDDIMMIGYDLNNKKHYLMRLSIDDKECTNVVAIDNIDPDGIHLLSVNDSLYLICTDTSRCNCKPMTIKKFDEDKNEFKFCAYLLDNRRNFKACSYKGNIYIIGGFDKSEGSYDQFNIYYDPSTNECMTIKDRGFDDVKSLFVLNGILTAIKYDNSIKTFGNDSWNYFSGYEKVSIQSGYNNGLYDLDSDYYYDSDSDYDYYY